ncbi:MAG: energy-coupling factor transporter transmembrane protein EcfT [Spirochaetes bacterium]|nr:energy-coupling factor transporter transmembrane protein EcfT [Spirochaetota bacterium]
MFEDIYYPGNSIIHRYDPRMKLIVLIECVVLFFFHIPVICLSLYLVLIMVVLVFTAGLDSLLKAIKAVLPLLILVIFITPLFNRNGVPVIEIFGRTVVTVSGILDGLRLAVRFAGITVAFTLYFKTTNPESMVLTLRWFGISFNLSLIITISMRYIPYIMGVYRNVVDAHKLRKCCDESRVKGFVYKVKNLSPVLISVLIHSIKKIPVLAMVLEKKGLGRHNKRTSYLELKKLKYIFPDILILLAITAVIFLSLFIMDLGINFLNVL